MKSKIPFVVLLFCLTFSCNEHENIPTSLSFEEQIKIVKESAQTNADFLKSIVKQERKNILLPSKSGYRYSWEKSEGRSKDETAESIVA